MFANNTMSQSTPMSVDLTSFHGRGEQPRTMFADEVIGHLVSITLRGGEYEVKRNGQPVIDQTTGKPMVRPNSAIAEWRSDNGDRVLTSWPCRYGEQHEVLLWDAFDETINLAVDHLEFKKETTNGRTFYSLTKVEAKVQQQPRAQQFVTAGAPVPAASMPWDYEG